MKKVFVDFNDLPKMKLSDGSEVKLEAKKTKKPKRVTPFNRKRI